MLFRIWDPKGPHVRNGTGGESPPVVVTGVGQHGWTIRNQTGGGQLSFVTGPSGQFIDNPAGTGSLNLVTGDSSADEISLEHSADFTDISEIKTLKYFVFTKSPNNDNTANITLVLDCSATGNGEGYLIYIAANNGASANDDWYQWDTTYPEANWWMPTPCTGDGTEAGATRTWDEWKTALAGVRVKSYALSLGSGEANTDTYVSSITVNDVVTDFESA